MGRLMMIADACEFRSVFRNAPEVGEARSGRNSPRAVQC